MIIGYTSNAAKGLQAQLASGGEFAVHSRVLGNVLYLMASLTSKTTTIRQLEEIVRKSLDLPPGPKFEEPSERKVAPLEQEEEFFEEEAEPTEEEAQSSEHIGEQDPVDRLEAHQDELNRNLNLLNKSLGRFLQDK